MPDKLAILQAQVIIADLKNVEAAAKSLNNTFKETVKQTDKISKAFNTGRIREYTAAIRELNNVTTQHTNIERQLADAIARTTNLERQQARLQTEQARTRRELAEARRAESRERQQAEREAQAEARRSRESTSVHAQLTRQVRDARQAARDYGAQMFQLRERLRQGTISEREFNTQNRQLSQSFNNATREAIRLQNALNRINQQTLPSGQRYGALQGRVTDILKSLTAFTAVDNIASYFMKIGASYKDTAVKLETLRMSQKSVFKTNEEVARQNIFLTDTAQKYGIELIELSKAYNNFSASAQGTTLEGEKSKIIFDAVTKSSAMLGVTTEDTNGILRALGQMMSKGKVQAEELRGQLGDRMAGAFRLFADGMGVSTAELDKMLKKGEVLAENVLPKFAEQLNKKYQLGINEQVETSQAAITRLTNSWTIFVDAVENRTNIAGSSISAFSTVISGLLKEMTPSSFITDIQKQQFEFNRLGILLKQNFEDTNKRKDLISQMIAINPNFLDGLNKEKLTLEQITERLMLTNQQYVQKILLQKNLDELNELWEEYGERISIVAQAYTDNAEAINKLTPAQYKILQSFTDGKITLSEAYDQLLKTGVAIYDYQELFETMDAAVNKNRLTSKGWIGTTKSVAEETKKVSDKYDQQIKVLNQLAKSQGNLLGINTDLINLNYKLGDSIDYASLKTKIQNKQRDEDYQKAIKRGRELKQAYVEFNGYIFNTTTGKNNGRKVGEWEIVGNDVQRRKPAALPEDDKKPKAASLTVEQKDALMKAQGQRDFELANNEKDRLSLKIGYEEYLQEKQNIAARYDAKLQTFLKGANAKEIQVQGAAYKKAIEAAVQSNKELYDERSKTLETSFDKEKNIIDRKNKSLEQNQNISDSERLRQQIDLDSELIKKTTESYDKRIKLATKSGQRILELEAARDEEIGKIEDQRLQRMAAIPEAIRNEIEYQSEILVSNKDISYEKQKQLILANKKLNAEERAYQLSLLDKKNEVKTTDKEIEKQRQLRDSIINRLIDEKSIGLPGIPTKEEIKLLGEYTANIERLTSENIQNQKDLDLISFEKMAKGFEPLVNMISSGLNDLGLNRISDQFTKMYQKILDEGRDFSLSTKEIFAMAGAVISDFAQQFTNAQKEKTISALDEQLKYSQDATEQELGFINSRLEALNSLEDLTEEQAAERNRLEDEARVYKDQQRQREKLIETQKARAEQKAAAQQALINGALAATMTLAQMGFIAGAIPAALALGFGIAQSIAIMSKDPVPKYWKGRKGGAAEYAITQDRGREIIAGEDGRIKSLGSDAGDKMTWLDKGDTVYTADETKHILKTMGPSAKIGSKVFQKIARESMIAPQVSIVNNYRDNSDAIAEKLGKRFDQSLARYDKPSIIKINGFIYLYQGANHALKMGTYDLETGKETFYGTN
ncbi:tape measure protein [Chryseobacterium arthrosphaerae]|uniref:tape measure protein n=1 Tax=Chryseobacterium arthrosphaerae TaxID=651561 RepID=UPI0024202251|nr:tape measure protein [Chryseobacterium arthrosphaerae]